MSLVTSTQKWWMYILLLFALLIVVFDILFVHAGFQYILDNKMDMNSAWVVWKLGLGTMAYTILLSVITYEFFEKSFIKLKDRLF